MSSFTLYWSSMSSISENYFVKYKWRISLYLLHPSIKSRTYSSYLNQGYLKRISLTIVKLKSGGFSLLSCRVVFIKFCFSFIIYTYFILYRSPFIDICVFWKKKNLKPWWNMSFKGPFIFFVFVGLLKGFLKMI